LVNTTTFVAEVFAASALHMVAALGFPDPEFAKRAHFILGTFHKLQKCLFILVRVSLSLILIAGKASVVKDSALKTITFFALVTSKTIAINSSFIEKSIIAVCCGAP
jgi:hypothetical protein